MKGIINAITSKIRNKQTLVIILIIGIVLMLAAESFKTEKYALVPQAIVLSIYVLSVKA